MRSIILTIFLLPFLAFSQTYKKYALKEDRLSIELSDGVLHLIPLSEKVIRVQLEKNGMREEQQFVVINKSAGPKFGFVETPSQVKLSTSALMVVFNKENGGLDFLDKQGNVFLSEKAGSRKLVADTVMGEPCFVAEQSFNSPEGESLFGLGQFQDGNFDLKHVSRKLTQVNSQIAIPFLYSSNNYGILWHQYGLTYFNPADHVVSLEKVASSSNDKGDAEVTTTMGTQRVSQQQAVYNGTFSVTRDGEYSIMLDLGDMDNRHLVVIDGVPLIDLIFSLIN